MKQHALTTSLALMSAAFLFGCQERGSTPLGPEGLAIQAAKTKATKVSVCHIPPGNPGNARIISVGAPAVPAHLAHGDALEVCLIINEVMYDPAPPVSDFKGEYVELRNVGSTPVDLRSTSSISSSLRICDVTPGCPPRIHDFFKAVRPPGLPLTIPAGGFAVIYDNGASGSTVPTDFSIPTSAVEATVDDAAIGTGLNNTGDGVKLLTADLSVVIDKMSYDGSLARNNGLSLQRCRRGSSIEFIEALPTPGADNACG